MTSHVDIWGHVTVENASAAAAEKTEEAGLMSMLRCRYGWKIPKKNVSLLGFMPSTDEVIFNPNTLQDLADIFETDVNQAFK